MPVGPANTLTGSYQSTSGPVTRFTLWNVVAGSPGRTPPGQGVFTVRFGLLGNVTWNLPGQTVRAGLLDALSGVRTASR